MAPRASELGLLRLVALGVVGPPAPSALKLLRRLGAMQAQDPVSAAEAVEVRTRSTDLAGAFARGEVVSSWPQRGTLHLVAAEDVGWLLAVVAAPSFARFGLRHSQLDLTPADLAVATAAAGTALAGGAVLTRAELLASFVAAGLDITGQRGYHLVVALAHGGLLCLGPMVGTRQGFVAIDGWVREPRRPERAEALREWASRYFTAHGPATVRDFAHWTTLPAADVRTAVGEARGGLATMTVDGVEHLLGPATRDALAEHRRAALGVHLLPAFDEFVLGYSDRGAVLDPAHAGRIAPGGNGVFRPTVVERGRVVGVWRRPAAAGGGAGVEPFDVASPAVLRAAARWRRISA